MNFWIPLVLAGLIIAAACYVDAVMHGGQSDVSVIAPNDKSFSESLYD